MIVVVALGLAPSVPGLGFDHADKIAHFLQFFVLSSWFGGIYSGRARLIAVIGLILLGTGIEFVQGLGMFRTFDFADIGANVAGTLAGLLAVRTVMAGWCRRVEAALA